jgi:flagellar biosynthetic protein FliQ
MTPELVIEVVRRSIEAGAMIAGPVLAISLIAGVAVSILQATTQINDMTLVFVPKILAALVALLLFGPWMLQTYMDFTRRMLVGLPGFLG